MELEQLKYPVGQFNCPEVITDDILHSWISEIQHFPEYVVAVTNELSKEKLQWRYRPYGWNIKQVVHHCADSHMNCFMRIKWTLTEEKPIIKFYYEDRWAELHDNLTMPIQPTLSFLEGLHFRLAYLMKSLSETDLNKSFIHPEHNAEFQLKEM